jgi:hypothetical protein
MRRRWRKRRREKGGGGRRHPKPLKVLFEREHKKMIDLLVLERTTV